MSEEVTCPACRHACPAPPAAGATCPHCGALLSSASVQAGPPAPVPSVFHCPRCGKAMPALCLFCPHCEEPLEEFRRRMRDDGWNRGMVSSGFGAGNLLAAIGATGLLLHLLVTASLPHQVRIQAAGALLFLLVFAAIAAGVGRWRFWSVAERPSLFLAALAVLGVVFLVGLACLLVFFLTCAIVLR
jgi:hypothetical protein